MPHSKAHLFLFTNVLIHCTLWQHHFCPSAIHPLTDKCLMYCWSKKVVISVQYPHLWLKMPYYVHFVHSFVLYMLSTIGQAMPEMSSKKNMHQHPNWFIDYCVPSIQNYSAKERTIQKKDNWLLCPWQTVCHQYLLKIQGAWRTGRVSIFVSNPDWSLKLFKKMHCYWHVILCAQMHLYKRTFISSPSHSTS